jgi:RNA polymerase sigma-70 factor, ECF subfamily
MTMSEIAGLLDLPEGTVASRLRRAREQFEARVERWQAQMRHKEIAP